MTTDPPTALATPAPIPEIQLLPVPEPEPAEADTAAEQAAGEGGGGVKVTRLVRSHAIRDSASPPPPPAIMSEGGSVQSERSTGAASSLGLDPVFTIPSLHCQGARWAMRGRPGPGVTRSAAPTAAAATRTRRTARCTR